MESVSGSRTGRTSVIAGLINGEFTSSHTYSGSCDADLLNFWLANHLLPSLTTKTVIVLDNARFHKGSFSQKLVEDAGHTLLFLPAYSPDLNPIEHVWAYIKSWLRKSLHTMKNKFRFIASFCKRLAAK